MRHLPREITDHIIDYLHNSPQDLRACACVCRAWLDSSRSRLFYRISVHRVPARTRVYHSPYEAIQHSPRIALYVRELYYADPTRWDVVAGNLLKLLRPFTRLRMLELVTQEWTLLMPEIKDSIRNILALPSLVYFKCQSDFS
jgi:hypothetical protein